MKINLPIIVFILLLSSGCVKDLDIKPKEHPPQLVIHCIFHPDSSWVLAVGHTISPLEPKKELPRVENAIVKITDSMGNAVTLLHDSVGVYINPTHYPKIGERYFLEVSAPGFETVTASEEVPEPIQILSVDTQSVIHNPANNWKKLTVSVDFKDEVAYKNFYSFVIEYVYVQWNPGSIPEYYRTWLGNYQYYSQSNVMGIGCHKEGNFNDEIFNGKNFQLNTTLNGECGGSPSFTYELTLMLRSITESYYNYLNSYHSLGNIENNLLPPTQFYTNIKNGYGIFIGFSTSKKEITYTYKHSP